MKLSIKIVVENFVYKISTGLFIQRCKIMLLLIVAVCCAVTVDVVAIDPCGGCHDDAVCLNTGTSHKCTCKEGYTGDGKTDCKVKWRLDGRCGPKFKLPNGENAECNPNSFPCCSNFSVCGLTINHCQCPGCIDYSPKVADKYSRIGCFIDDRKRAISGRYTFYETNTVERCYERARKLGYEYFAVQYTTQCFTSQNAGQTYNKYGATTGCRADGRGGTWKQDVYRIGAVCPKCSTQSTCVQLGNEAICRCNDGWYNNTKNKSCLPIQNAYTAQITMNQTFATELSQTTSPEFNRLALFVQRKLLAILQSSIATIADIIVTKFNNLQQNTTITAQYTIVLTSSDDKIAQIGSALNSAFNAGNLSSMFVIRPLQNIQYINKCDYATTNNCSVNADCVQEGVSFNCKCRRGFYGSGTSCNKLTLAMELMLHFKESWHPEYLNSKSNEYILLKRIIQRELSVKLKELLSTSVTRFLFVDVLHFMESRNKKVQSYVHISYYNHTNNMKLELCKEILTKLNDIKLPSADIQSVEIIKSYDCCLQNTTGRETYKGVYIFNTTLMSDSVFVSTCKYNTNGQTFRRSCGFNELTGAAMWSNVDLRECNKLTPAMDMTFTVEDIWDPLLANPWSRTHITRASLYKQELRNKLMELLSTSLTKFLYVDIVKFSKLSNNMIEAYAHLAYRNPTLDIKLELCKEMQAKHKDIKLTSVVISNVKITRSYDCCLSSKVGRDDFKGEYIFDTILVPAIVVKTCKYNSNQTFQRFCVRDRFNAGVWRKENLTYPSQCLPKSATTGELINLDKKSQCVGANCPKVKAVDLAVALNKAVPKPSVLTTPKDISFIANITSVIVKDSKDQGKEQILNVTENILQTIGTIMETDKTLIKNAEKEDSAATSLLKDVDSFSKKVGTSMKNVGDNVTVSKKNIGIQVAKVNVKKTKDVKIYSNFDASKHVSVGVRDDNQGSYSDFLASISIPGSTFDSTDGLIYSQAYLQNTLFVSNDSNIVQSIVLSVSLSNETKGLTEPLILQFKKRSFLSNGSVCVFWKFKDNNKEGHWSREGCKLRMNETTEDLVTCECTHLTNFALLLDVYQTQSNPLALSIVSWIGCGISLVGLVLTIIIFSSFSHLRGKLPSKILISLCCSLTIFLIIFLAGIEAAKDHRASCMAVAGLLHYFMMTSFSWMCVAAVNLYVLLVKVFRKGSDYRWFIRASILAWGIPLIIAIITAVSDEENYLGNNEFCFPQGDSAHFGVLLPVLIVFVINLSLFITILVKLTKDKQPVGNAEERKSNLREVRIGLSVSVLLGLSWILAIFAVKEAEFIFQLFFCIFNSLQGFFIFVLYCLTSEQVKKQIIVTWCHRWADTEFSSTTFRTFFSKNNTSKSTEFTMGESSVVENTNTKEDKSDDNNDLKKRNVYADAGPSERKSEVQPIQPQRPPPTYYTERVVRLTTR